MLKTGTELKSAREQAGLSVELVAQRTKFKLYRIVALEDGDFDSLPDGICLDAIVRAYAVEVGLDPEPMIVRVRMERGIRPGDLSLECDEPVGFIPGAAHVEADTYEPSRATVAFSGLAVLALLGWGSYLFEAGGVADRNIPGKIYAALTGRNQSHTSSLVPVPSVQTAPAPSAPAQTTVRVSHATPTQAPARVNTAPASIHLTGSWRLATEVESSSYAKYEGMLFGYELQLEQDGDRVTGIGRKILENGSGVYSRARTPITISGVVDGDRLMLTFIEEGTKRSSEGAVVLRLEHDGTLRGRFSSNAAQSAGRAEARRIG